MRAKDYESDAANDWCAGCGDYGILRAMEKAFADLDLKKHQIAVFGGIGCSGKTPYYVEANGIHTLHGRVLPFATGAKLANPELTVIAVGGDGDGLGIGAGHFVNAGRRNLDLTYLLFNNEVYGLTKGQAAPTIRQGEKTKAMTRASLHSHINPILLALTSGFSWIGRGYAYDLHQLSSLIQNAIQHKGSAFIEILQPCPVYNDLHDKAWFEMSELTRQPRIYSLSEEGYDPEIPPDANNTVREEKFVQCVSKAHEWGERIPLGLFYKDMSANELTQQLNSQQSFYYKRPPAKQPALEGIQQHKIDMQTIMKKFLV
jgi:2-oxoglutarate ferredoxin oxidoreductase subunit beta